MNEEQIQKMNIENQIVADKPLLVPVENEQEIEDFSTKVNRDRYVEFPDILPTFDLMPFPIDEHKHIGNYETKHNLYLTIAHSFNRAMEKIKQLEARIEQLESK
jgi:hypothetical protein